MLRSLRAKDGENCTRSCHRKSLKAFIRTTGKSLCTILVANDWNFAWHAGQATNAHHTGRSQPQILIRFRALWAIGYPQVLLAEWSVLRCCQRQPLQPLQIEPPNWKLPSPHHSNLADKYDGFRFGMMVFSVALCTVATEATLESITIAQTGSKEGLPTLHGDGKMCRTVLGVSSGAAGRGKNRCSKDLCGGLRPEVSRCKWRKCENCWKMLKVPNAKCSKATTPWSLQPLVCQILAILANLNIWSSLEPNPTQVSHTVGPAKPKASRQLIIVSFVNYWIESIEKLRNMLFKPCSLVVSQTHGRMIYTFSRE